MQHVFVYGTLRAGEANDIDIAAARHDIARPRLVGAATVRGRLYDFGSYPGLVIDGTGGRVQGDVYEIDDALVAVLDAIEGIAPGSVGPFLAHEVTLDVAGGTVACRFYPVRHEAVAGLPEIVAGDWIAHRRGRL
jgi:gamma-glutamylcyclotransferase (GGCT)/AIG2-like uncharacterized protein YtfP